MPELPESSIYEQIFNYMPWGILISEVLDVITKEAPKNARLLDMMCGPGHLLGQIAENRPDLVLEGVDVDADYISHATSRYPDICFTVSDSLLFESQESYDIVICTGGLHHISYDLQEKFIRKILSLIKLGGFCVIGDPYLDNFTNEQERQLAAAKLGYEYLRETIEKGAPRSVVKAAINILDNDVMKKLEFKTSLRKIKPIFQDVFSSVEIHKAWPKEDTEYGDYYIIGHVLH